MFKNLKIRALLILLVLVQALVMFSGCSLFPEEDEPDVPALKTPQPVKYSFFRVKKDTLSNTVTGVGKVASIYYTNHAFPTSGGTLKAIHVTLGQYVEKGQLLLELDNSNLEIQYLQAEIDYEKEKSEFQSADEAYRRGEISAAKHRVAQLQLQMKQRAYESLKYSYENTMLYAKVSGKIVYINTSYTSSSSPKEIVAGEPVIAIDSENEKYTYLLFDRTDTNEDYLPQQFRVGETLNLKQVDNKGNPVEGAADFTGTIVGTDAIIKDTGLTYVSQSSYYCKMYRVPEGVKIGSSVRYTYTEYSIEDCLVIPTSALFEFNGNTFVYMLDPNTNLKKEVPVQIGFRTSTQAQVLDGLKENDVIIKD